LLSPKANVVSLEMTTNERALFVKAISIFAHENVTVVPASVLNNCTALLTIVEITILRSSVEFTAWETSPSACNSLTEWPRSSVR